MEQKEAALLKLYGRRFISLPGASSSPVRVMSYNMLANAHVKQYLYRCHRLKDIFAPRRQKRVAEEISACRPDILCVQELQKVDIPAFAAIEALNGFEHCFGHKRRVGEAPGRLEGVAVFVRTPRFRILTRRVVNFDLQAGDNYDQDDALLAEMTKACTAVIVVVETAEGQRLAVTSVHLPFNPKQGHVKLGVLCLLFKTLVRLRQVHGFKDVIICGDFNTVPNSMLYRFIAEMKVDLAADLRGYSNQMWQEAALKSLDVAEALREGDRLYAPAAAESSRRISPAFLGALLRAEPCFGDEPTVRFESKRDLPLAVEEMGALLEALSEQLQLGSAYREIKSSTAAQGDELSAPVLDAKSFNNEAFVTFFGEEMKGCVDYIFYSRKGSLVPLRVLQPPPVSLLRALDTTLPSALFGSDHLSLVADFAFKPPQP